MTTTAEQLASKHCQSCEGGVPPLGKETVQELLKQVPDWRLTPDGKRLRREWRVKDFQTGLDFFQPRRANCRGGGPPPRFAPGRLPQRQHRGLDPRHRRAVGKRLHPGGQDRQAAGELKR